AISGRVVDSLGMPEVERTVIVTATTPRAQPRTTRTDDRGEYHVGTLPDGTYSVTVAASVGRPPAGGAAPVEAAADTLPQTVVLRRGDDVGGIDFSVSARAKCQAAEVPTLAPNAYGSGSIAGRVTNIAGRPLACVDVVALRGGDRVASAVTDTDGRYVLNRLRPGGFSIEFKKGGYVTLQWGQREAEQPGRPVAVRDRETVREIDMALPHGGAISGAILDEYGDPVENVTVR